MPMSWNDACREAVWGGWMPYRGVLFMVLLLIAIVAFVALARSFFRSGAHQTGEERRSSSLEILKERYAKGELEREEYLQKMSDLGG